MTDTVLLISPAGVETPLSELPGVLALETQGLFMPPVDFVTDDVPLQPGARLRSVRTLAREITMPVHIEDDGRGLRQVIRDLAKAVNPQGGDSRLRVTTEDGAPRELAVRYAGGLELTQSPGLSNLRWQKAALIFRAFDPYWYDSVPQVRTFTTTVHPFFPLPPMQLSAQAINGTTQVDNQGDADSFPLWTVAGPCTGMTFTNETTGEALTVNATLTAGQQLVIDTRRKTVLRSDGLSLFANLTPASSLWAVGEGVNTITLEVAGSTVDSYVNLIYSLRYLTP